MILQKKEVEKMNTYEVLFDILLLNTKRYNQRLIKVTTFTEMVRNNMITIICCYLLDAKKLSCEKFTIVNNGIDEFCEQIKEQFKGVPIINLSEGS